MVLRWSDASYLEDQVGVLFLQGGPAPPPPPFPLDLVRSEKTDQLLVYLGTAVVSIFGCRLPFFPAVGGLFRALVALSRARRYEDMDDGVPLRSPSSSTGAPPLCPWRKSD